MIVHFYIRHLGDYARDTANLSALEVGVYDLLLDFYYSTEKPLPLNRADLNNCARARNTNVVAAVNKVLALFFTKTERGYIHKRVEEEIAKAKLKSSKAAASAAARWEAAKANANASAGEGKSDANAYANASIGNMRSHRPSNASQDSSSKPKTKGTKQPQQLRARIRTREDPLPTPAASGGGLPDGDVLDVAKARMQVDALVAHLRDQGVTDASAAHASVRQWAHDPAMTRDVIDEGIARLRQRHNVRHPMSVLAQIVPDVLCELDHPLTVRAFTPTEAKDRAPPRHLTPVQQREAEARAVRDGIYGSIKGEGEVIDGHITELHDERTKQLKHS